MRTLFACITALGLSSNAQAFTLSNSVAAAFGGDDVRVYVADHDCTNLGISNQDLLGLLEEAVDQYWNTVPTSRLRLETGGIRNVGSAFQTDRICNNAGSNCDPNPDLVFSDGILVSCNTSTDNFTSSSILALTVPNSIEGRTIRGGVVLLNDRADNQFRSKGRSEQLAILAHEIGHAIGLGHSEKVHNLMHYESHPSRRALGWDDIDGVTYLYPTEQPFDGCGSIAFQDGGKGMGTGLLVGLLLSSFPALWGRLRRSRDRGMIGTCASPDSSSP